MLTSSRNALSNFDFKPNFDYGIIHCEYEMKSSLPRLSKFKPYFHNIIYPFKIVMLSKPYVWFKNKKGKNNIYQLFSYNFRLVSLSEWHLGVKSKYKHFSDSLNSKNIFALIISFMILAFDAFIWFFNIFLFKMVSFFKRNKLLDASECSEFGYDSRETIEKQSDKEGRTTYVKSRRKSYVSFDKILSSYITYDVNNNLYIEELTITYIKYEGWVGPLPADEKMKLVVYPYYENHEKPKWFKDLQNNWWNCLIFESLTEDRLKYVITKNVNGQKLF